MSELIAFALSPVFHTFLLLTAAFLFLKYGRNRVAQTLMLISLSWLWLIGCSPATHIVMQKWEHQFDPFKGNAEAAGRAPVILVLAAGYTPSDDQPPLGQLINTSVVRLTEAVRLNRLLPASKIVVTGNRAGAGPSQALTASMALLELGVLPADTALLTAPRNTEEEIKMFVERFKDVDTVVLVTSAVHMPRAMILAHQHGLHAVPAPTDYYFKSRNRVSFNFSPSVQKLLFCQMLLHEWVGILKINIIG